MTTVFYILFILSCIVLIVSVLLQPGKADAGALFSSSISSTAFGPRGTQSILAKITIGAAAAFMLIAIALSLPAITGQRSLLQSVGEEETAPTPAPQGSPVASPAASPAAPGGEANTGAAANTTTTATPAPAGSPAGGASPAPSK
ncbi:MAG TPA: preprotein translocase subunit SecG [Pyrinomonadaceae bacterium]|nr:preprotein translocase subunit SecG [Pyrinomonadaceae bacterium]